MAQATLGVRSYGQSFLDSIPIMGSQIKRIGFARAFVGGGSMYLSIPLFVFSHLIGIELLHKRIFTPLLGLAKTRTRDYIILDRHQIEGLPMIDKFNCVFCGYANGIAVLLNEKLGQMAEYEGKSSLWRFMKKALVMLLMVAFSPFFLLINFIGIEIIYGILISRPLGMHRTKPEEVKSRITQQGFAAQTSPVFAAFLSHQKVNSLRLIAALEQIESSWCPLRHLKKGEGVHYPEHHKRFFRAHEIEEMQQVLQTEGTVSDIKPYR
jgi:hypothetical protein